MQHMQTRRERAALVSSHTGLYRKTEAVGKEFHDRCHFYSDMNTETQDAMGWKKKNDTESSSMSGGTNNKQGLGKGEDTCGTHIQS